MSETVDSLKQRLVGAFVILSLAIIFLPMIFDQPHNEASTVVVPVPPKPAFKTFEIAKPSKPDYKVLEVDQANGKVREGATTVGEATRSIVPAAKDSSKAEGLTAKAKANAEKTPAVVEQVAAKKKAVKPASKPAVATPSVSHLPVFKNVWMVQLGTFGDTKNAYRLRDQLRADGFDGHTKIITLSGKKAIKVFTGPFVKKRDAAKTKKRVDQKYKVDSRIIFFDA